MSIISVLRFRKASFSTCASVLVEMTARLEIKMMERLQTVMSAMNAIQYRSYLYAVRLTLTTTASLEHHFRKIDTWWH